MPVPNYTPASRPSILIVDDYADAREVLAIMLRAEGFDVITAETGPEALRTAVGSVPHLIVMDLKLPGMSGVEVAGALRAREDTARIPLMAVTGCSEEKELEVARAAGFQTVLVKPCMPSRLIEEIRRLLESATAKPGPEPDQS
jgi:CheY-like chemotaxis protein